MLRITYHNFILFVLFLLPTFSFAQGVYQGQVINSITEAPIADVTVTLLKEKSGTRTNNQGYFRLIIDNPELNDTLSFSFVGYKTFLLPVSAYQNQMFILLTPANNQLAQVNIGGSNVKTLTLDKFGYSDVKDLINDQHSIYRTFPYYTLGTFAKYFEAPTINVLLTTIELGRRDLDIPDKRVNYPLATSNKYARFLIHIMIPDSVTGLPGKKIFTREITLTDNSLKVTIDVRSERIVIPTAKFYIAVEWLKTMRNEVIMLGRTNKVRRTTKKGEQLLQDASVYSIMYQPFLTQFPSNKRTIGWETADNVNWKKARVFSNIALSATIVY